MGEHQFDLAGRFGNGCATHPIVEALEQSSSGEEFSTRIKRILSSLSTTREATDLSDVFLRDADIIEKKFGSDIFSKTNADILTILRAFQND